MAEAEPEIPNDLTMEHLDGGYLRLTLHYPTDDAALEAYKRVREAAKTGVIKLTFHVGAAIPEN